METNPPSLLQRYGNYLYFIFMIFILLLINQSAYSQIKNPKSAEKRQWNMKAVDLRTAINELAKETGKNFVLSPQVTGKITFISTHPLAAEELYQAFLALLTANGYEAIADGPVIKIVPNAFVKEENTPLMSSKDHKRRNEMAVTVVQVKYVSATELVKALRQLVFHFGYIEVYAPTNDIIISDHANNIHKIIQLVKRLDKPSATTVEVIHLRYAQASDLVTTIASLLSIKSKVETGLTLGSEERNNDILVHGGTPQQHMQIRSLIAKLDLPIKRSSQNTEVIYLKYLRSEKVAAILKGLIDNYLHQKSSKSSQTTETASSATNTSFDQPSQNNKAALPDFFNAMTQNSNSSQTSLLNAEASSSTSATTDFSNMNQSQPKSGSVSPYVQWEESTNAVIVTAPLDLMIKLKAVIAKLDIRRPQVLIEAIIAEVEADRASELGIELNTGGSVQLLTRFTSTLPVSGTGTDNNVAISNPPTPDTVGQGLTTLFFSGNNLRMLLRALEQDTRSNILSTPNIVTLDNEPAQIKVGQQISFSIGQIQNNPTGGNPFNFYNQQDVGLTLTINPQIAPNNSIKLIIQQELSSVLPGQTSAGSNPNLSERFIHTTVMAHNGDILVLGGLIQNEWQENISKVPFLGDLPLIGVLFRSTEKQLTKQNLMIFLRPTIIYDDKEAVHIAGSKYDNLRQQQFETDNRIALENVLAGPVLPNWGKEERLPPPFMLGENEK